MKARTLFLTLMLLLASVAYPVEATASGSHGKLSAPTLVAASGIDTTMLVPDPATLENCRLTTAVVAEDLDFLADKAYHTGIVARIKQRVRQKMNEPYDTVRDSGYWLRALKHGKVDFNDETIKYPKFIRFCWKTYKWGDHAFNHYDTSYVVSTGKNWKLIINNKNWLDGYNGSPLRSETTTLRSHLTANIGFSLSFMAVSIGYSVSLTNLFQGGKVSKNLDFSFTCARFTASSFLYEYNGKSVLELKDDKHNIKINDFRALKRRVYGLDAYYFFNNKRYAQAAAYCYSKYQLRSAGSLLAGFSLQHHDMSFDSSEVPESIPDDLLPRDRLPSFSYNDYCVLVGYGFNWVPKYKGNWVINATLTPYIGYRQMLKTNYEDRASSWSINLRFRLGVVYNHKKWFYGLQGKFDAHRYKSSRYHFYYSTEDVTFLAGIRF